MNSISDDKDQTTKAEISDRPRLESSNRTVSFSNLQQQRRLPTSVNTFRPASACAQLEPVARDHQIGTVDGDRMDATGQAGSVVTPTPMGLSSDPLVGRRLESTKPPQLEHHRSRLTPIRAKGAAMIDDIKHKCSELFSSADHPASQRSRGRQSRDTAASMPPSHSPGPPVRPPRRRGLHQRSKSVSARPAIASAVASPDGEEEEEEDQELHVAELRAVMPGSSLDRGHPATTTPPLPERSQRQQSRQSPVGEKLASLANQLKHSAVDFFHQPPDTKRQPVAGEKSSSRSPLRSPDETIVPTDDLREWKPVIKTSTTSTSGGGRPASGRSFRVLGAKGKQLRRQFAR